VEKIQEDDSEEDEGDWEWEDDVCCNHDVTVDLNEPHSESGKYWKAEWARYREEAKSDIEQLVKYKANAKSFAAKKDTEASQLSQKLKEEQAKVTEMEGKIADMAAKLASSEKHGTDKDRASLTKDLARQNTLIAEYRDRVKDLETRLKEAPSQSNSIRSSHQRIDTSPRTEQNLLEVSRELRKARSELRQLDRLRDEVKRLKSNLATSRERVATLEAQASAGEFAESSRIRNLEKELHEAKEESQQKDIEIRKLKKDYEALKRDAKSRTAEAMQVLQGKNAKIEELEKKLEDLRAANASSPRKNLDAAIAEHNWITQDLKSGIEALSKPSKYEKAGLINQHARAASVEDMTLDMTQRSLLRDKDDYILDAFRQNKPYDDGILTDWTADIPVLDLQVKEERRQHQEAEKLNREPILEGTDASPSRRVARHANQRLLAGNHRVISNVLSNRVNGSSGKLSHKHQHPNTNIALSTENDQSNMGRRIASPRTAPLAENKATMSGALDRPTRQPRILSKTACALSSGDDTPAIDLVQDQYSRLGGPSTDRSVLGNTSRCTLPPDRLAAARARLEQKKMERRKAGGQDLDKENVRP
jgi:myosin heavy subunit